MTPPMTSQCDFADFSSRQTFNIAGDIIMYHILFTIHIVLET